MKQWILLLGIMGVIMVSGCVGDESFADKASDPKQCYMMGIWTELKDNQRCCMQDIYNEYYVDEINTNNCIGTKRKVVEDFSELFDILKGNDCSWGSTVGDVYLSANEALLINEYHKESCTLYVIENETEEVKK